MVLCRGGSGLSFQKSHVLTIDEFGSASIVGGDRTIEDMIILESSDEPWKTGATEQTIKLACVIGCGDLACSELGFVVGNGLEAGVGDKGGVTMINYGR